MTDNLKRMESQEEYDGYRAPELWSGWIDHL